MDSPIFFVLLWTWMSYIKNRGLVFIVKSLYFSLFLFLYLTITYSAYVSLFQIPVTFCPVSIFYKLSWIAIFLFSTFFLFEILGFQFTSKSRIGLVISLGAHFILSLIDVNELWHQNYVWSQSDLVKTFIGQGIPHIFAYATSILFLFSFIEFLGQIWIHYFFHKKEEINVREF